MGVVDFMFELGQLKRVKRSGWWLIGVKDPESVAEHSFRAAAIAYLLAVEEGADPARTMMMALFNDVHEARINDMHKLGQRYVEFRKAELMAYEDQMKGLPQNLSAGLRDLIPELMEQKTKESIVARDADLLECALQAREYAYTRPKAMSWIDNEKPIMKTEAGKAWISQIEDADPFAWWDGLKRIER